MDTENSKPANFPDLAQRIVDYCQSNVAQISGMDDLAAYFESSYQILRRITLLRFDKTPLQILNDARIERMKQLLAKSDLSCRHVGQSVGFYSEVRASRFFKRQQGINMTEYRQAVKDQKAEPAKPSEINTFSDHAHKHDNVVRLVDSKKSFAKKHVVDAYMVTAQVGIPKTSPRPSATPLP